MPRGPSYLSAEAVLACSLLVCLCLQTLLHVFLTFKPILHASLQDCRSRMPRRMPGGSQHCREGRFRGCRGGCQDFACASSIKDRSEHSATPSRPPNPKQKKPQKQFQEGGQDQGYRFLQQLRVVAFSLPWKLVKARTVMNRTACTASDPLKVAAQVTRK